MLFLPANKSNSIDVVRNPSSKQNLMPVWCRLVLILQIAIVYFYATVAKLYPDWLDGTFIKNLLSSRTASRFINIYQQEWFYLSITYGGILFDLLIIPLMLYKKTRKYAFVAAIFFHLFNKMILSIGVFPFLALAFSVLFFPPELFRKYFFRNKIEVPAIFKKSNTHNKVLLYFFLPFFIIQLALPIRHWFIKGDVLWTEEGHRLSWRMMLRNRSGDATFLVINNATKEKIEYDLKKLLTISQIKGMKTKPDLIWQTAQKIKEQYQKKGEDVSIYVDSKVSINKKPKLPLIDPNVDLAKAKWNYFWHNDWILIYD